MESVIRHRSSPILACHVFVQDGQDDRLSLELKKRLPNLPEITKIGQTLRFKVGNSALRFVLIRCARVHCIYPPGGRSWTVNGQT